MNYQQHFDVIVVGGGHAGTEAAAAAARMGMRTLLLTHNIETLGQMSCNPAIGGIGKGHLVKEIDALGGIMAHAADLAGIQFRTLNASKGPAVRATRAQADRVLYKEAVRYLLENQPNLWLFQQEVTDLLLTGDRVSAVKTRSGLCFSAKTVVLTAGTFLNGQIHIGMEHYSAGRAGDPSSISLAQRLQDLALPQDRLKTGTPPRIDGRTIDFSKLTEQPGDNPEPVFSFLGCRAQHPQQLSCWLTETNSTTHQIIADNLDRSPLYSGKIASVGPRYCPSIEDKIHRFADKTSHHVFLEPEGLKTHEFYPNGISTSLPFDVQVALVHSMKGLEQAHLVRPGYAIEYDYFDPRSLNSSLETQKIKGLFFAGQINGTTGYEEAAAQGLLAGINAALQVQDKEAWCPRRDQAYIGVMVDDLITRGVLEPYRMFTSRAEYRLQLREDNADLRLTEMGYQLGVVDQQRWQLFEQKREQIETEIQRLKRCWVQPYQIPEQTQHDLFGKVLDHEYNLYDLLCRPSISYHDLKTLDQSAQMILDNPQVIEQVEVSVKYHGYIMRQQQEIVRQLDAETLKLPKDMDYSQVPSLSTEVQQRLNSVKPETIGQASRVYGVTPSAISLLLVWLKRNTSKKPQES